MGTRVIERLVQRNWKKLIENAQALNSRDGLDREKHSGSLLDREGSVTNRFLLGDFYSDKKNITRRGEEGGKFEIGKKPADLKTMGS